MKYKIKDNQAGFVLKDGIFQKMVTSGTYHFSKTLGYQVEVEEMYGEVGYLDVPYQVLAKDPAFLASTIHMEIPDGFAGFLFNNGKLVSFANRKEYTFWNVFEKHEIRLVDVTGFKYLWRNPWLGRRSQSGWFLLSRGTCTPRYLWGKGKQGWYTMTMSSKSSFPGAYTGFGIIPITFPAG